MTDGTFMSTTPAELVEQLVDIMARLRDPESGCAWDLQQTFDTIVPYTVEEAYEVADAVAAQDWPELREELGDLLLQVVFHSRMAQEQQLFDLADVVSTLNEKLLRRHPHVFGEQAQVSSDSTSIEQIKQTWEQIKSTERHQKGRPHDSALDGVPSGLPALQRATKLQKKAAKVGFDWPDARAVWPQVGAEMDELEQAFVSGERDAIEEELGDVLFTLVNFSRHVKLDADMALRRSAEKFQKRFHDMEQQARDAGQTLASLDEDALEALWRSAKERLKHG
jgi:ATP diphosphatase